MPWQDNKGGPWGSGDGDKPKNPWGQKSSGDGNKPTNTSDFDDFIRRSQERLRGGMGGGNGRGPSRTISGRNVPWTWLILAALVVWLLATSIYRIEPAQRGVEQMFGEYHKTTLAGTHFK